MKILAKSAIDVFLVMLVASAALFAHSDGSSPDKPQNDASVLDARQIVSLSIAATERSWKARDHYAYMERDEDRRLDSLGQVKSETVDVTRTILVNGAHFEQLMQHNGQLPSAKEQKKSDEDLDKLKHETPTEQTARLGKDQENRSFLRDLLDASTSILSAKRWSAAGQAMCCRLRRIRVIARTASTARCSLR